MMKFVPSTINNLRALRDRIIKKREIFGKFDMADNEVYTISGRVIKDIY